MTTLHSLLDQAWHDARLHYELAVGDYPVIIDQPAWQEFRHDVDAALERHPDADLSNCLGPFTARAYGHMLNWAYALLVDRFTL